MRSLVKIDKERQLAIVRGIIVGLLVGIVVSSFRWLVEYILHGWNNLFQAIKLGPNPMLALGLVLLLFLGLTFILGKIIVKDSNVNGSGIPQVEAQLAGQLTINPLSVFWRKYLGGLISIGSGAFLGREGPSVQLGAAVGELFSLRQQLTGQDKKLLIAMGSAAGLSAAFGAPIAGTLFVLEEVYRSFSLLVWLGSLASALMADIVSSYVFGLQPVLNIRITYTLPLSQYGWLIVLGVVLGLAGYIYQQVTLRASNFYRLFWWLPRQYHFGLVFLTLLPIGLYWPQLLGGGSLIITKLGQYQNSLQILALILIIRFVGSALAFGSGVPGGIFLPILTLGAITGELFGAILLHWQLIPAVALANMLVLGMVGYFACVSKAPFTAIILIAEMVGSMEHLVPMALVALIAYLTVDILGGEPIYEALRAKLKLPSDLALFSGRIEELRLIVAPTGPLENKEIRQLELPKGVLIEKIVRDSKSYVANGDFILRIGDEVILLVNAEKYAEVWQELVP